MAELPSLGVTSFYAAILGAIYIKLTLDVINLRRSEKLPIGSAEGSDTLKRAIGARQNFGTNCLLVLIMLLLADYAEVFAFFLHLIMLAFVASRILHIYSLTKYEVETGSYGLRKLGMMGTFFTIGALAVINFYISIFG